MMKRRRRSLKTEKEKKSRNTLYLPEDLLVEILSRVPKVYLAKLDLHDDNVVKVISQFILSDPLSSSSLKEVDIRRVFHCDGLLLCTTMNKKLVVWNPCSGETSIIIKPLNPYNGFDFDTYALGKSSCNNEYKILSVHHGHDGRGYGQPCLVRYDIYDFTSNSWSVVGETRDWSIPRIWRHGTSVDGNTYWLTYTYSHDSPTGMGNTLRCFDFSTESCGLNPCSDSHIEFAWKVVDNSIVIDGGTTEKHPETKKMVLAGEIFKFNMNAMLPYNVKTKPVGYWDRPTGTGSYFTSGQRDKCPDVPAPHAEEESLVKDDEEKEKIFDDRKIEEEKKHSVYLVRLNLHGIHDDNVEKVISQCSLSDPLSSSSLKQVGIRCVFHCDGLLLCTTMDNTLVVWNPCSGDTSRIIKPRFIHNGSDTYALVTREEQNLCLLTSSRDEEVHDIDVWMATKIKGTGDMSWSKLLTAKRTHSQQFLGFRAGMSFSVDREAKVFLHPTKFKNSSNCLHIVGEYKHIKADLHDVESKRSNHVKRGPTLVHIQQGSSGLGTWKVAPVTKCS
ncbi:hypothetical protein Bca52824_026181 [Brassica carinata]|uniref:F-box associated beta-propeller type 1 domain-containing protein n=1 Tax=Brassica carinata TaxID=52824 RepID=A0A8X7SHI4_BRACI|nr:hypothetical protein Bca52824_026181 [Brassica carinata]